MKNSLLFISMLLLCVVLKAQNLDELASFNGTYYLLEAERSLQPGKQTANVKQLEIGKNTPVFKSNGSVLLATSECEKCTPSIFTYKKEESEQLGKSVFYNSMGLYMIPIDKESFIYVMPTQQLGGDWSNLRFSNFYSKNKNKVSTMTKEKLVGIAKSISITFKNK